MSESRGAIRAARSIHAKEIAQRFGRNTQPATVHFEGNALVLPQIGREQARAILLRHAEDGRPDAERILTDSYRRDMMGMVARAGVARVRG